MATQWAFLDMCPVGHARSWRLQCSVSTEIDQDVGGNTLGTLNGHDETCISEKLAYLDGSLLLPIPVAREQRESGKTLTSINGWKGTEAEDAGRLCCLVQRPRKSAQGRRVSCGLLDLASCSARLRHRAGNSKRR